MVTISIDSSELKRLGRDLDRLQARLPQAIANGLNEGGDKVRTQVQRALQKQTSVVKYASVTQRVMTIRAYATGPEPKSGIGPGRPGSLSYTIVVGGRPTKIDEFKTRVTRGPGGGVTAIMWGNAHKFARSFEQAQRGGLRARLNPEEAQLRLSRMSIDQAKWAADIRRGRLPIRSFDGPNLAKEAVKDQAAEAFFRTAALVIPPIVEKHLAKILR